MKMFYLGGAIWVYISSTPNNIIRIYISQEIDEEDGDFPK